MHVAGKISLGVAMLAAALFAAPARGGTVGKEVPGLGPIVYNEGTVEVFGEGPDTLVVGLGAFDVFKTDPVSAEARLEYRWGRKLVFLGPTLGVLANTDGGVFGYGGAYFDFRIAPLIFTPAVGLGYYREGDSKDLGGNFPFFHIALDVSYPFESGARLGVKFAHISNAYTHSSNPGQESVLLTLTVPLANMF